MSRLFPFRFNTGDFGAVYLALERETAIAELVKRARGANRTVASFHPRNLFVFAVHCGQVLDLTDSATREAWDITLDDLQSEDYSICQQVAAVARRNAYEAILYPSATGHGTCLAMFYDQRHTGSHVVELSSTLLDLNEL